VKRTARGSARPCERTSEPVRAGERPSPIGEGLDMTMTTLTVLAALAAVPLVLGVLLAVALGGYMALKWARG